MKRKMVLVLSAVIILLPTLAYAFYNCNLTKRAESIDKDNKNINFGVCFHLNDYSVKTKDIIKEMTSNGTFWIRTDWVIGQEVDRFYDDMVSMGIKILAIINYGTMNMKNFSLAEWETTVRICLDRYPKVDGWEVWNEPNEPYFQLEYMDGTPRHYVDILRSSYYILKSRNPNATLVAPAITELEIQKNMNWLQNVINLGALNYLDAVSIHLYSNTSINQQLLNQIKSMVGDKPIWITEVGLPSVYSVIPDSYFAPSHSESDQDAYLRDHMNLVVNKVVDKVFWYELWDSVSSSGREAHFGLANATTKKPAYYTFMSFLKNK
jgi:hypothetical protein